ncbi:Asp-tRNA(Asn)/Glu-tRNA(Gln) amidotransferase subunit GatA [Pelobium manganitolerans]|uniref:Asp-tRNA(Asn)/Glu-tRNA(Gln) amidotransferase subunit GatA n=1 Tax=Pelobium manganitolerans TaxID=1842495 RepID=UPI000E7659B8|nr:Asp-tRNA(Asn)/Glu-tRNA(Gln) amidotransferase subunit GatA [Pelobium manganitolerans]
MLTQKIKSYTTFSDLQQDLNAGTVRVEDLVNYYLGRIEEYKRLNAFLEVFADEALAKAAEIQAKIDNGTAGKLAGMIIGLKDNISFKGHKMSASSKILDGYEAVYSATVVERILQEDAIIIGRLNCDEFAMGASNETSYFGPVKNYIDETKVSGGSSGGSAVAVQADLCFASLASDTGGSIRQPAAFCGVFGLKPTYARVSRYGVVAYASSFDQVGPIAKSVEDVALLLEVIAGRDAHDGTSSSVPVPSYASIVANYNCSDKKRIAYIEETLHAEGLDPEIKANTLAQIENLKKEGHTVEPVSFEYLDYVVAAYYILTTAEASSNLARYDGVHYGYRSDQSADLISTYKKSRSEGFGDEVKRRIMLGTFVLSAGYYDAYYSKAQKARRLIKEKMDHILEDYDFIITPTTPAPAFNIGEEPSDPMVMYLADIFTVGASLAGLPAISLPSGNNQAGLPLGLQVIGRRYKEEDLLAFSKCIQKI